MSCNLGTSIYLLLIKRSFNGPSLPIFTFSYYEVFSHLQNGQLIPCENERKFNLENKAQPRDFSTQIPLANLVMGQTPFYQTLIKLKHHFSNIECVHLLVIKLEHPIFGFEQTNIEH